MIGKPAGLALVLLAITVWTTALPAKDTTTRRSPQPTFADTMKQLTNQLMNISADITLDTRTPPKIKQLLRKPIRNREKSGSSHPGVAVPIDDSDLLLEESTKKLNFYKIENKPTTDGGLSTWVLLNSQTASPSYTTTKTSRKPVTKQKPGENKNVTLIDSEIFNKITKPLFKKRPALSTTQKPSTITEKEHKPTKVKPLSLSNPNNNKTKNDLKTSNKKYNESIPVELSTVKPTEKLFTVLYTSTGETVQKIEAKNDEIELMTTTQSSKRTRRPTVTPKRKKNKKRRRPALEKSDITNSTKLALKSKEKPISTQIYNYLSREIIPTVSVGLVGLVVTAGLASYFLYPFGAARRSYEIDRKDKEDMYYYNDEYAPGGIAEEEVIGKVIAGMPVNNYDGYRMPASNVRHKQNEYGFGKPSQSSSNEAVYLTPTMKYRDDDHFHYRNHKLDFYNPYQDVIEHNQETGYTVDDTKFLVGAKEVQEVTPVAVPEHGPRNLPESKSKEDASQFKVVAPRSLKERNKLKFRRRRSSEKVNKIDGKMDKNHTATAPTVIEQINGHTSESQSILKSLQLYLENTIRAGLEYFDTASRTISKYLLQLQNRISNKINKNDTVQNKEQPRGD